MIYRDFHGKKLPLLGFGTMRFPLIESGDNKIVDEEKTAEMFRLAMEHGVNYFDTAYIYHEGESERIVGRILSRFPRESFYLADKFPGHMPMDSYEPDRIFREQLEKCQVDYFDFYLFHNVDDSSIDTYRDAKWKIPDYLIEQKKQGKIHYLGFSTHGSLATIRSFLEQYREHLDFCQIQLNYLDWSLQDARAKVELLKEFNMPIFVMEPVRGGRLANLNPACTKKLQEIRPDHSNAAWAFRFLQDIPEVKMILSGMSNIEQVQDNLKTFTSPMPLSDEERSLLFEIAEEMKKSLPCTSCRYCTSSCPMNLNIPRLISLYNEMKASPNQAIAEKIASLDEEKRPGVCIGCGACVKVCPQNIDVPEAMQKLDAFLKTYSE